MKFNYKSRKGFTLIELLVVIGILAVLAAIAIPSVAGLIDRANVSADKTNSNEMTNAVERFASEYELYCQDIASGALDPDNLDSAQGRVKNVVGVTTRAGIEDLEIGQDETVADNVIAIYRDTKYPVNALTMQKVVENYTKTSSSAFEPKQSDMHYWYSPDCGVVVFAEPDADVVNDLNSQIQSGQDAKGNQLSATTQWINLTLGSVLSGETSLDLSTIDTDLSTNTWEDIQKVSQAGKTAEVGWSVGSTKTLTINGTTKTATLIGINHDGNNTTTWIIHNIGQHVVNTNASNAGGWEASDVRGWLNNEVFNSLSNKDYIKTVTKITNNIGYQGTAVTTTTDNLFLLSAKEIGLKPSWNYDSYKDVFNSEGTTYAWFESNIIENSFRLRSPSSINSENFFGYTWGEASTYSAINMQNIYPAFVIG